MQAVHQSIYNTQVVQPVMTPDQFATYVQWPGDRPFIPGGGSTSGTNANMGDTGAGVGSGANTFDDPGDFDIDDQTTLRQMMDSLNRGGSDDEMAEEDQTSVSDEF
ncbi:unnamed protein product [Trifolium pratense]|uniref:Uncharacterized protein n=2 Tax=Trifolium pratense TaxID=57577 RepID=A0ACB0LQY5_TRIPR|nr:unnamed protein product [Trifolium pratense]